MRPIAVPLFTSKGQYYTETATVKVPANINKIIGQARNVDPLLDLNQLSTEELLCILKFGYDILLEEQE